MDNETKMTNEQINELFRKAKEKEKGGVLNVSSFIDENLSPEDAQKLKSAMKDPKLIKSILSSPQAQKFFEKFSGKGNEK
ncbi:MAG: hypothetical protein MSH34_05570 [Oscillospiraceae bacterium]|nr:hypothetical protein [Oscillospiraceae bacterium]MDD7292175.1 hypothetical protein [Clostridiaceae bacterium]MDY5991061.1 hypothetical protein [Oscillospiraceae bacterium]